VRAGEEAAIEGRWIRAMVRYLDPEPNGLASMLGGLIEANLAAHPDRGRHLSRVATYAVYAPDVDVGVSLRLSPGAVLVRNGVVSSPHVLIRGDSETLVSLSSVPLRWGLPDAMTKAGREVVRKLLRRELVIRGLLRHPRQVARLTGLLAVS
jgi:hypothetical protein